MAPDILSNLDEIIDYFDQRMDVDYEGTGPNEEMRMYQYAVEVRDWIMTVIR